jgi:segregation and condensation protein B
MSSRWSRRSTGCGRSSASRATGRTSRATCRTAGRSGPGAAAVGHGRDLRGLARACQGGPDRVETGDMFAPIQIRPRGARWPTLSARASSRRRRSPEQERMVEAILFASAEPVTVADMNARMPHGADAAVAVEELRRRYEGRGVRVVKVGEAWAIRTAPDLGFLMQKETVETRKLSRAAIETLAIVAYHQPVTRAEIEEIRGVSVSRGTIDQLARARMDPLRAAQDDAGAARDLRRDRELSSTTSGSNRRATCRGSRNCGPPGFSTTARRRGPRTPRRTSRRTSFSTSDRIAAECRMRSAACLPQVPGSGGSGAQSTPISGIVSGFSGSRARKGPQLAPRTIKSPPESEVKTRLTGVMIDRRCENAVPG